MKERTCNLLVKDPPPTVIVHALHVCIKYKNISLMLMIVYTVLFHKWYSTES